MFVRYRVAALTDLTILHLFDEYRVRVPVDAFSVAMRAAILLQALLNATLALEHKAAACFKATTGGFARFIRVRTAWRVLLGSNFMMLGAIYFAFGDDIRLLPYALIRITPLPADRPARAARGPGYRLRDTAE